MNDNPLLQDGSLTDMEMDTIAENLRIANGGREPTEDEINRYLLNADLDLYPGHDPLPGYEGNSWFSDNMLIFGAIVMVLFTFW